jgi:hypothetical protein
LSHHLRKRTSFDRDNNQPHLDCLLLLHHPPDPADPQFPILQSSNLPITPCPLLPLPLNSLIVEPKKQFLPSQNHDHLGYLDHLAPCSSRPSSRRFMSEPPGGWIIND